FTCGSEDLGAPCGTRDFNPSQGSTGQVVDQAGTSTGVSADINPSVFGQGVQFTATVPATAPGAGTPTGTVQFEIDGSDAGGPQGLDGQGVASVSTTALALGTHAVTATCLGVSDFTTSTGTLAGGQVVLKASTSTGVTSSPNPSVS